MSIDNPKDAVKAALFERLSHPVLGVLLLAVITCNWKTIAYLFISNAAAEYRIAEAANYATAWTLVYIPIGITVSYVIIAPILKVLALMYDRYVTNWENVRAYKAQINVIERNTLEAKKVLLETEQALALTRRDLEKLKSEAQEILKEKKGWDTAVQDYLRLGSNNWKNIFRDIPLPVDQRTHPAAYKETKERFARLEYLRNMFLNDKSSQENSSHN